MPKVGKLSLLGLLHWQQRILAHNGNKSVILCSVYLSLSATHANGLDLVEFLSQVAWAGPASVVVAQALLDTRSQLDIDNIEFARANDVLLTCL